jgi:hypothetical protein
MQTGSTMKIGGVMNNVGVWRAAWGNLTTVEYNGSAQNVVIRMHQQPIFFFDSKRKWCKTMPAVYVYFRI